MRIRRCSRMASIVKRRGKYVVVYKYRDRNGDEKERWESFQTRKEAQARRSAIEFQQENGVAPVPATTSVREFLKEYVNVYGKAYISVDKEIQRISKEAYEALGDKGVRYVFPAEAKRSTTLLVLKEPKTKSSVRKIYMPRTVALMLEEWRHKQEEYKGFYGPDYCDYNMVITYPNGRPVEPSGIRKMFEKLIKENDLPKVVFHSLRHSSVTYKLKINNGNIKAVQGDSGHSQASMVTDTYSHILDEDRWKNAELFEKAFYEKKGEDGNGALAVGGDGTLPGGADAAALAGLSGVSSDDLQMLLRLLQNPEMAAMLRALAGQIK